MVQITYSVTPFEKLLWLSLIKTKNKLVFNTCSKLRPESTDYSKVLPSSEILKKWFGSSSKNHIQMYTMYNNTLQPKVLVYC